MRNVSERYNNDPIGIMFPNKSAISVISESQLSIVSKIYTITLKVYMFWGVWHTNGHWVSPLGKGGNTELHFQYVTTR